MKKIIKLRWMIFAVWLTGAALLTVFQPDVNAILHERGQDPLTSDKLFPRKLVKFSRR